MQRRRDSRRFAAREISPGRAQAYLSVNTRTINRKSCLNSAEIHKPSRNIRAKRFSASDLPVPALTHVFARARARAGSASTGFSRTLNLGRALTLAIIYAPRIGKTAHTGYIPRAGRSVSATPRRFLIAGRFRSITAELIIRICRRRQSCRSLFIHRHAFHGEYLSPSSLSSPSETIPCVAHVRLRLR